MSKEESKEEVRAEGEEHKAKAKRGFAAMSKEKQREIASLGGKAAHRKGTAHEFNAETARAAGRLGGQVAQKRKRENGGTT